MNKNDDKIALRVFAFLGKLYEIVADFRWRLHDELAGEGKIGTAPSAEMSCRSYKAGVMVHLWVEMMLRDKNSLTWEMDISHPDESWLVDARVSRVDESGTTTLLHFPDRVIPNFDDLEREIPLTLNELFEAGTKILREEFTP